MGENYRPESLKTEILMAMFDVSLDLSEHVKGIVKKNVGEIVYDPYAFDVREYNRRYEDGGFLGSWDVGWEMNMEENGYLHYIFSNPENMVLEPPTHGMNVSAMEPEEANLLEIYSSEDFDRREYLDQYIAEGTHYDYVVPGKHSQIGETDNWWTRPRDYFTPSIEETDAAIGKILAEKMKKYGFDGKVGG